MSSESLDTVKSRIEDLYKAEDMTDCEFEFPNKEKIRSHQNVLGIASPVFKAMLFGDLRCREGPTKIEETKPDTFRKMLQFVFTESTEFETVETACDVYIASDKYLLPSLKEFCENYIVQNVNELTFADLLDFVKVYENKNIYDECIHFIRSSTSKIFDCENFLQFDINILKLISEQPALDIESEVEVFTALEKWAQNQCAKRGVSMSEIIPEISAVKSNIRFLSMRGDKYARGPGISELLTPDEQRALSLNIQSLGVCSIPEGLSLMRNERSERIKYQYKFKNIFNLFMVSTISSQSSKPMLSTGFNVKNTAWKLKLVAKQNVDKSYSHIVLYIVYNGYSVVTNDPACDAMVELKFLTEKKECQPFKRNFQQKFNVGEDNWNYPLMMKWESFFDTKNGFYNNGDCTVEASVELVLEPEVEINPKH